MQSLNRNAADKPSAALEQPMALLLAAVCAGILLDRLLAPPWAIWLAMGCLSLLLWLHAALVCGRPKAALVMLLLALACLGGSRRHFHWTLFSPDDLGFSAGPEAHPICLEAIAAVGPQRKIHPAPDPLRTIPAGDTTQLRVQIARVRDGRKWRVASGCALLTINGHLAGVAAGDRLQIFATFIAPRSPGNPGAFDFSAQSRAKRELTLLRAPHPDCVAVVAPAAVWNPRTWLHRVQTTCQQSIDQHISQEQSPFASAVLLGARGRIDERRNERWRRSGAIHLLAISGLHVGILAAAVLYLARLGLLRRRTAYYLAMALVVFYALLAEGRPPVARAAVMVIIFCVGRLQGRRAWAANSLAIAGLMILLYNPDDLFNTGVQLSFLAVSIVLAVSSTWNTTGKQQNPLDRLIAATRPWPWRATKRMTISSSRLVVLSSLIWLGTAPLVAAQFHLVTPMAIPLSPLLTFPMATALLSGFVMIGLNFISSSLAAWPGRLCDSSLGVLDGALNQVEGIRPHFAWTAGPETWWLAVFYGGLLLYLYAPRLRPPRRWLWAGCLAWSAVGAVTHYPSSVAGRESSLVCTFIDVGHGTSVLLELPDGRAMLYDAGSLGSPRSPARKIAAVLWSKKIAHLDAVIISHADADHYNALPRLLEKFSVGAVYVSPMMFEDDAPALHALANAIRAAAVPLREIDASHRLTAGAHLSMDILHPPKRGVVGGDNANSIVLVCRFAGRRIILPGDLESPGLEDVLAEEPLDCDVAMAPHHGSVRSQPSGFAAWCTPETVVISGGFGNRLAEVIHAFENAGATVLHTARDGAVEVMIHVDGRITVQTRRTQRPVRATAHEPQLPAARPSHQK